jgi:Cu/Ag efflux pump CusA
LSVWGKAGRASTATDPAPTEMFETVINLKPRATDGVDNASELNEDAIARPLNDATVVYGDGRIDQIAS